MAGIHCEAGGTGVRCGAGTGGEFGCAIAGSEGVRIGSGVDLNAVGAEFAQVNAPRGSGIDEEADPSTHTFQARDHRRQPFAVAADIKTVIGRDLRIAVRHQRDLGRPHRFDQFDETRIAERIRSGEGIALDVEFDRQHVREREHVVGPHMAQVRSRMHGDAVGTGSDGHTGRGDHVGQGTAARIAQDGDLVQVHAQAGHDASVPARGRHEQGQQC